MTSYTQDMFGIPLKEGEKVWCVQGVESPLFSMRTPFFLCQSGDYGRLSIQDDPLIRKAVRLARQIDHRNNSDLDESDYFFPREPTILNVLTHSMHESMVQAYLLGKSGKWTPVVPDPVMSCSADQQKIQNLIGDLKVHEVNPYIFVIPDLPMGALALALHQSLTEDLGSDYAVVITNGSRPEFQNLLVVATSAPQDPIRVSRGRTTGGPTFESHLRYGVSLNEQLAAQSARIKDRSDRGFELRNYLIRPETFASMVELGRTENLYLESDVMGSLDEIEQKIQAFLVRIMQAAETGRYPQTEDDEYDDDPFPFIFIFRSLFHLSSRAISYVATPLDLAMVMLGVGVPIEEVVKRLVDQVAFMCVLAGTALNVKSAQLLTVYNSDTKAVFKILKRNITLAR